MDVRKILILALLFPAVAATISLPSWAQETIDNVTFHVKYLAEGVVYLDRGSGTGLKEGQSLSVRRSADIGRSDAAGPTQSGMIATLRVLSVAASSAVCEIVNSSMPIEIGDEAVLTQEAVQQQKQAQQEQRITGGREYPVMITFTGADPVVEEARAEVPRPPTPDVNRMRGRIGVEYSSILTHASPSSRSNEVGLVARMEVTRIGGTHWNFNGYWRGRFTNVSGPAAPATISDLINRTYTLSMQYDNPDSRLVMGGGRLYLPWATSLDTIDGGYVGRKVSRTIVGIFGGTTPDPTSYDYNPNGKIAGAFLNVSGGSFEGWHYSTTAGVALGAIGWQATRHYGFLETSVSIKHNFSLYDATEIDLPHQAVVTTNTTSEATAPITTTSTGGLNRSYLTIRYQPRPALEFELNDTYFRNFPTFDPSLIGTGLLDRYLFQGLSGGVRVNIPQLISVYTDVGKSNATGDTSGSWNQMYGLTLGELWRTGVRADARYSKFSSSFGSGDYKTLSLSRPMADRLEWQLIGGLQNLSSTLTSTTKGHFVNTLVDWFPGKLLFFEAGYTWQRGGTMNYDQLQFMVGKRFGGSRR